MNIRISLWIPAVLQIPWRRSWTSDKMKNLVIVTSSDLLDGERDVRREVLRNMTDELKGLEQKIIGCNQRKP